MKALLVVLITASFCFADDYSKGGASWWAHVRYLADDSLKGRDTGSEGYLRAVQYVKEQLGGLGLNPQLQPVRFETRTIDRLQSTVSLTRDGRTVALQPGFDLNLSSSAENDAPLHAGLVFAGYGLTIPDVTKPSLDLHNLDLKGKIVVYIGANGPSIAPQNVQSFYASAGERWSALRKAGAVGIATIANPRLEAAPPAQSGPPRPASPAPPSVLLAERPLQENAGQKVALALTRTGGAKLFEGSEHSFDEIVQLARDNKPLPEFPLKGTLEVKPVAKRGNMTAPNVAAMLPGSDPKLKNEYVVISAHLDHIGVGAPVNGDSIYNGAMDNASGVASLLEVARLFHESGVRPKRSVLFLLVTAEEKGLLGSRYFAAHPTVPLKNIVADVNMDALLPLYDLKVLEVQGLNESTLGPKIEAAAKESGVAVQTDREPEQNRFIRSDHFSFVRRGIPALAFKFGYEYGSPEEKTRLAWWDANYHKPSDDADHPMNREAAAKFNRVIYRLVNLIADDSTRPSWQPDSFFRQFARR